MPMSAAPRSLAATAPLAAALLALAALGPAARAQQPAATEVWHLEVLPRH